MTNGTKEDGLREQAVEFDGIANKHIKENISHRQQFRGISAYERLRAEWLACNPVHSEAELLAACIVFARACGLILREKILQSQLERVGLL